MQSQLFTVAYEYTHTHTHTVTQYSFITVFNVCNGPTTDFINLKEHPKSRKPLVFLQLSIFNQGKTS